MVYRIAFGKRHWSVNNDNRVNLGGENRSKAYAIRSFNYFIFLTTMHTNRRRPCISCNRSQWTLTGVYRNNRSLFLALINRTGPTVSDCWPIWLGYQIMVISRGKRALRRPQRGCGPSKSCIPALRIYFDIGYFMDIYIYIYIIRVRYNI